MTQVAGGDNNIVEHDGVSVYTHAQGKVPQPDRIQPQVHDSIDEKVEKSVDLSRRGKGQPIIKENENYDPDFELNQEELDDTTSLATVQGARLNQNRFSKKPTNNRLSKISSNEDEKTELGDNAIHAIDQSQDDIMVGTNDNKKNVHSRPPRRTGGGLD